MGDRFLNPLGFQATSYRRDAEMIGSTAASQGVR
jgi:type IV secretory pathway component VirB8